MKRTLVRTYDYLGLVDKICLLIKIQYYHYIKVFTYSLNYSMSYRNQKRMKTEIF